MGCKRSFLVSISAVMIVLAMPLSCLGQYYPSAPYPNPPTQYYAYPQPGPGYVAYAHPYYYYLAPSPQVIRRWEEYRRWLEDDHLQRSPLNPESTTDYMLRNFW